jgi:glycosyltransferase involved in cell wall biosynthesis
MAAPLNLLLLTHNFPRYRDDYAGVFLDLLARRLAEHDIRPIVVAPHDAEIPEREEYDGVRLYRFRYALNEKSETIAYRGNMQEQVAALPWGPYRFWRFLYAFKAMATRVIEREKIDIISGHWLMPAGIVMKRLARKVDLPMILSSHGTDIRLLAKQGPRVYQYFKPLTRNLYRWTVVSSFLRDQLMTVDPNLQKLVEVLPLPHDERVFFEEDGVTREDNLVVAVTRYTEQKRVEDLIRAFHWVTREEHSARLELYGSGPLEAAMQALIVELGLERQVIMHTPISQDQLRKVYNRAAVVVLNSENEGFGLALSEAMLCGAAVIGADSGGIRDIIEHDKRGLLVEVGNITKLAESILTLLANKQYRSKLARTGYSFARDTYASGPLAKRYAGLIREAVAAGQVSR